MESAADGFVILGFPRSGTTLLRRFLDAHSNIDCPGETYLLSAAAKFLGSHRVVGKVSVGVESGLSFLGFSSAETLSRLRDFVMSFRLSHLRESGKRVWGEKTATDVFYLESIERLFGDQLKFICLHRHPLDVVVSAKEWCDKCEAYPPELHEFLVRNSHPYEAFASAWVERTNAMLAFQSRNSDRVVSLKYEDLIQNTEGQLRSLIDFLGLDWEAGLIESAFQKSPDGFGDWKAYGTSTLTKDRIGRWRKLSSTTIGELGVVVNRAMEMLNYEPISASPTHIDPKDALRRYQWGLRLQQKDVAYPPTN